MARSLSLYLSNYLTRLGKPANFELGKHLLAIYDDIEDAIASWN